MMLMHPTLDKLQQLRCAGMARAFAEQFDSPAAAALSFEERLGLLADRELTEHHARQLTNRLRRARLKHDACIGYSALYRRVSRLLSALAIARDTERGPDFSQTSACGISLDRLSLVMDAGAPGSSVADGRGRAGREAVLA